MIPPSDLTRTLASSMAGDPDARRRLMELVARAWLTDVLAGAGGG